ncbi:MAG: hypothetical protein FD177_2408 [Desulfovibrionaceae bacterium]|nr:MAG: hypothetical protein FD177_2408 [Desulfovibrionaceae bacterium]
MFCLSFLGTWAYRELAGMPEPAGIAMGVAFVWWLMALVAQGVWYVASPTKESFDRI